MKEKEQGKAQRAQGVGFVACYKDEEIAFAREFDVLMNKPAVKSKVGQKDLLIKHTVPEGMLAVY